LTKSKTKTLLGTLTEKYSTRYLLEWTSRPLKILPRKRLTAVDKVFARRPWDLPNQHNVDVPISYIVLVWQLPKSTCKYLVECRQSLPWQYLQGPRRDVHAIPPINYRRWFGFEQLDSILESLCPMDGLRDSSSRSKRECFGLFSLRDCEP
jgi:hypothetical protein